MAIAPDQSYIVYVSNIETPGHQLLYVSLQRHGEWSAPLRLPEAINGSASSKDVHLRPDQRTLYFTRGDLIWEVPFPPILRWARQARPG